MSSNVYKNYKSISFAVSSSDVSSFLGNLGRWVIVQFYSISKFNLNLSKSFKTGILFIINPAYIGSASAHPPSYLENASEFQTSMTEILNKGSFNIIYIFLFFFFQNYLYFLHILYLKIFEQWLTNTLPQIVS